MNENRQKIHRMQEIMLRWAKGNLEKYPWRTIADPYNILISELLLQKTDAKKVEQVYLKFIQRFPKVFDLYQADIKEIEELIKDIGLFYRAKRIKKIAEQIVEEFNGIVPDNEKELRYLYGIGDYISNAILCFAFKKRVSIVDTNVLRVYERVFGLKSSRSRPRIDKEIWKFAQGALPLKRFVEYNYALLDFASKVCTARNPSCNTCVARTICKNPFQ